MKRKVIKLIILSIALGSILYFSISLRSERVLKLRSQGNKCVCEITSVATKTFNSRIFFKRKYYYHTSSNPPIGLVPGEEYYCSFDPSNPEDQLVELRKPYFNPRNRFVTISPKSLSTFWYEKKDLEFQYSVNGIDYCRIQNVEDSEAYEKNKSGLYVKYMTANPAIAYLLY